MEPVRTIFVSVCIPHVEGPFKVVKQLFEGCV